MLQPVIPEVESASRPLTDEEFGVLQHFIDALTETMASRHFSLVVETDFHGLMAFLDSVSAPLRNPSFNPATSDLSR